MVIVVTAMDTHGSWHTNFASFVLGISKADIASETGSLWRAIAVTKVLSFLCLRESYIHTTTQLVVKYTIWAMVEVRNEPFLGFHHWYASPMGKKANLGSLGTWT